MSQETDFYQLGHSKVALDTQSYGEKYSRLWCLRYGLQKSNTLEYLIIDHMCLFWSFGPNYFRR